MDFLGCDENPRKKELLEELICLRKKAEAEKLGIHAKKIGFERSVERFHVPVITELKRIQDLQKKHGDEIMEQPPSYDEAVRMPPPVPPHVPPPPLELPLIVKEWLKDFETIVKYEFPENVGEEEDMGDQLANQLVSVIKQLNIPKKRAIDIMDDLATMAWRSDFGAFTNDERGFIEYVLRGAEKHFRNLGEKSGLGLKIFTGNMKNRTNKGLFKMSRLMKGSVLAGNNNPYLKKIDKSISSIINKKREKISNADLKKKFVVAVQKKDNNSVIFLGQALMDRRLITQSKLKNILKSF